MKRDLLSGETREKNVYYNEEERGSFSRFTFFFDFSMEVELWLLRAASKQD